MDQRGLVADQHRPRLPDLRAAAARGPAAAGPGGRHHLCRRPAVGRRLCLRRAGRDADRHLRRVRHHPRPGAAEHVERRVLRHRAEPQPALRHRRLAGAGQRHRGPGGGDQLAGDPSAQRRQRPGHRPQQRPGEGAAGQSQQPGAQPWRVAESSVPADHDAVRDGGGDAFGAAQQRCDPAGPRAGRAGDGAGCGCGRAGAVVPGGGPVGDRQGEERDLRPDLAPCQSGRAVSGLDHRGARRRRRAGEAGDRRPVAAARRSACSTRSRCSMP